MEGIIILFSCLILVQGLLPSETIFQHLIQKETEELFAPLLKEYTELSELIVVVRNYQDTQEISSRIFTENLLNISPDCLPKELPLTEAFAVDVCLNLTKTLTKATYLAANISSWTFNLTLNLASTLDHLLHCGSINPFSSVKCLVNDIGQLKETIDACKSLVARFRDDVVGMFQEIRLQFRECLGLQYHAQSITTAMLVQAKLCDGKETN